MTFWAARPGFGIYTRQFLVYYLFVCNGYCNLEIKVSFNLISVSPYFDLILVVDRVYLVVFTHCFIDYLLARIVFIVTNLW